MKRDIFIYTNKVGNGWKPQDIESFLGGSEEIVVQLASELAKKYNVNVFFNDTTNQITQYEKANYYPHSFFCKSHLFPKEEDIVIEFKTIAPKNPAKTKIHFSSEVETPRDVSELKYFVNISEYHKSRNFWIPQEKNKRIYLGCDFDSLDKNKTEKVENTILYCSSPDRGLVELLNDWTRIKKTYPELVLNVAYGFKNLLSCSGEQGKQFVNYCLDLMKQDGINYLGQLDKNQIEKEYWKSQYWALPLQNPDSELFCLNAVKSKYCGAVPIVNKIGALRETVGDYIPYSQFTEGNKTIKKGKNLSFGNWEVLTREIEKLFKIER